MATVISKVMDGRSRAVVVSQAKQAIIFLEATVSGQRESCLLFGCLSVEFDMDTHSAKTGVNNNFYLTSPPKDKFPKYCDIQGHPGWYLSIMCH